MDYAARVLDIYRKLLTGNAFGSVQARLRLALLEVTPVKPRKPKKAAGLFA
jgi:hypothetical protein